MIKLKKFQIEPIQAADAEAGVISDEIETFARAELGFKGAFYVNKLYSYGTLV